MEKHFICRTSSSDEIISPIRCRKPTTNLRSLKRRNRKNWYERNFENRCRNLKIFFVVFEAMMGEVYTTCGKVEYLIDSAEQVLKDDPRPSSLLMTHKKATVYYAPYGVIGK